MKRKHKINQAKNLKRPKDEEVRRFDVDYMAFSSGSEESSKIDKEGGRFKSGLIQNVSIIKKGDALGHGMFIDDVFLAQVADSIGVDGIKARFTHPHMSSDGAGTFLGKGFGGFVEGDKVLADLHFSKTSRKTPKHGDLGGYVMEMGEETPDCIGLSIAFRFDPAEENNFVEEHTEKGEFKSPDPMNKNNYPHARLKRLLAVDVVDSPAANDDGLFSAENNFLSLAEDSILYVLGISDVAPDQSEMLGVNIDRAKGFAEKVLFSHNLEIVEKKKVGENQKRIMETENQEPPSSLSSAKQSGANPEGVVLTPEQVAHYQALERENKQFKQEKEEREKAEAEAQLMAKVEDLVEEKLSELNLKKNLPEGETKKATTALGEGEKSDSWDQLYQKEVIDKLGSDPEDEIDLAAAFEMKYGTKEDFEKKGGQ